MGDVDRDGTDDLVWRHAPTGRVLYWGIENGQLARSSYIHTPVGSEWTLVGVGELDSQ